MYEHLEKKKKKPESKVYDPQPQGDHYDQPFVPENPYEEDDDDDDEDGDGDLDGPEDTEARTFATLRC